MSIEEPIPSQGILSTALLALEATPERFRFALAFHSIEVRYDVRGMRQQIRMPDEDEWADVVDSTATKVREIMASVPFPLRNHAGGIDDVGGVLKIKATPFNELMANACAHNQVDPLIEYIRSRPKWDRIPRLSAWIWHCFDVAEESEELADWASEFVIIGAIARALNPGVKLERNADPDRQGRYRQVNRAPLHVAAIPSLYVHRRLEPSGAPQGADRSTARAGNRGKRLRCKVLAALTWNR